MTITSQHVYNDLAKNAGNKPKGWLCAHDMKSVTSDLTDVIERRMRRFFDMEVTKALESQQPATFRPKLAQVLTNVVRLVKNPDRKGEAVILAIHPDFQKNLSLTPVKAKKEAKKLREIQPGDKTLNEFFWEKEVDIGSPLRGIIVNTLTSRDDADECTYLQKNRYLTPKGMDIASTIIIAYKEKPRAEHEEHMAKIPGKGDRPLNGKWQVGDEQIVIQSRSGLSQRLLGVITTMHSANIGEYIFRDNKGVIHFTPLGVEEAQKNLPMIVNSMAPQAKLSRG